ncbi:LppP/LprE family lipoprotein [Mycolicibacterium smegmatis]|uniref:LppP/LprE family lipoprotein n=1 Tax=Mycolicibacterium smegmatis TaxID=1772 RepID=UPI0009C04F62|nr:LppP/LprE family lipoprotein [Mycolicibacterium smegmatis]
MPTNSFRYLISGASAVLALASLGFPSPAHATPQDSCGVDLASPVIQSALAAQPSPFPDAEWSRDPGSFEGNFDPCATLSVVIAPIDRATGSSPSVAMLFHRGACVGPATPTPRGFTSFDASGTRDDTVSLRYKIPGSCNACADGTHRTVRYQWREDQPSTGGVHRLDPLPPG